MKAQILWQSRQGVPLRQPELAGGLACGIPHPIVAPEKFVAALALQYHGHVVFAGDLHDRVVTKSREVSDWVVAPLNQLGDESNHVIGRELDVVKGQREMISQRARVGAFVAIWASGIADAKSVHRARILARGKGCDRAG